MMSETEAEHMMRERQEKAAREPARLPLSALLSYVLVAFTIEFDNEFEHQMPHRTTNHGATTDARSAPWLVSLAMWATCMQFVDEAGVTVEELQRLARTGTNLDGLRRWGYLFIEPDPTGSRAKQPRPDAVVRPTRAGRKAQEVWYPLFGLIEQRWQERFGTEELHRLREALWAVCRQCDLELPDCLPILGYGLFSRGRRPGEDRFSRAPAENAQRVQPEPGGDHAFRLPLSTLLSRVLLAFAIEFERESDVSLAISANVVRVLHEDGVPVRELPRLTGVSKEAISMAMGILQEKHLAVVEPDAVSRRFKVARLTPKGQEVQDASRRLLDAMEERWQSRFGADAIRRLREALERLVGEGKSIARLSPLFQGLEPYPDGWRAAVRALDTLPHYPMVLHRGGFPDGS